jgi:signal transduction histidine kinase
MKFDLRQWFDQHLLRGRTDRFKRVAARVLGLLTIPPPDRAQLLNRIRMERDIVLPVKAAGVAMLLYSFYFTPWIGKVLGDLEIAIESTQYFLGVYIGLNLLVAGLLLAMRWVPLALIEWSVFTISLVDGIFLSALTLVTGGPDSVLYWLFLGLIVRSAASVPRPTSQLMLNLTLCAYYVLAGVIEIALAKNLEDSGTPVMDLPDRPAEHLVLQTILLLLLTLCCYGLQVLLERQRQALDQAREFAAREVQLRSAGRMAAEFAHQIKNPLAIINTAAFSLQRSLKNRPEEIQLHMIQEEVERADRIITQVMGYAQLTEGRVEKLNITEELDQAVKQVFPPAADYGVQVHCQYAGHFPPLLMQRRHVSETFLNLLQNAREALNGQKGNVFVSATCRSDYAIEVAIRDDGPGIASDKHEKIFEAYYTTKDKGTGLGLATVKHNVELYGGSVRVDSELGKGARFIVLFPARTLIKLAKQS